MSHVTEIDTMANNLEDLEAGVSDLQIVKKIIWTLPSSFCHFFSLWDNLQDDKKNIASLTARLLEEETLNKMYGVQEEADAAFVTRQQPSFSKNQSTLKKNSKPRIQCSYSYCQKPVHNEASCWTGIADEKAKTQAQLVFRTDTGWF